MKGDETLDVQSTYRFTVTVSRIFQIRSSFSN